MAPRPIVLYGPLEPEPLRILWLSSHSPWGGAEGRPKKDYKGLTALLPFSQLHSVLMRFGQIFQDLFQVLTKKRPKTDNDIFQN